MKKFVAIVLSVNVLISGCSTFMPSTQTISVACSESQATLQVNGEHYKGNAQMKVSRNANVSIMCTKPGYLTAQKSINKKLSGTGIADIVGTFFFLFPGIGLFTPGAWTLEETNVNLSMMPEN